MHTPLLYKYELVCFKCNFIPKNYASQVQPDWGLNLSPPRHANTLHVTDTIALTTWPSVTSPPYTFDIYIFPRFPLHTTSFIAFVVYILLQWAHVLFFQ